MCLSAEAAKVGSTDQMSLGAERVVDGVVGGQAAPG